MRYGVVILPELPWAEAGERWRRAEEYGFDHAWTYDHLAWRSLADGPWFGTMPTLTAAASVTSRIRLGTFVANPNYRHPVVFARDVLALDDISDGRVNLGIGAGGIGWDATVLGRDVPTPAHRAARLGEFTDLLDRVLTTDGVDFTGEYYTAVNARSVPGCRQRPRVPFIVAAGGPKTIDVAVRFGQGWVTTGAWSGPAVDSGSGGDVEAWWRSVAELCRRVDDALAAAGREPDTLDRYLSLDSIGVPALSDFDWFIESVERAERLGFTDVVVHWPRATEPYAGPDGDPERVLEQVADRVLGTRHRTS